MDEQDRIAVSSAPPAGGTTPGVDHEESDINIRLVLWILAGSVVFAVVVHLALGGIFQLFKRQEERKKQEVQTRVTGETRHAPLVPLLQPFPYKNSQGQSESPLDHTPVSDMQKLARQHQEQIGSYGWVDEQAGVVRIPIDRAQHLLVERMKRNRATMSGGADGGAQTADPAAVTPASPPEVPSRPAAQVPQ